MRFVLNYFAKHPWLGLGLILSISLLASFQLEKLKISISADDLLVQNNQEYRYYQRIKQIFGDDQVNLIYLQSERLLKKEKLIHLKQIIAQLEQESFVDRVESLFSVVWVKTTVDGFLDKQPYLAQLPNNEQEEEKILKAARLNPLIRDILISTQSNSMAIAVVIKDTDPKHPAWNDQIISQKLSQYAEKLSSDYETSFAIGFPLIRTEITQTIKSEQTRLFPYAVGALLIALLILLKQPIDIILPLFSAAFSILWTFGLMAVADIPINVVTSTIPILLIIVGSTEDIHLLSEFRHAQKIGLDKDCALQQMANRMGPIVLLTFISTYLGFLSVGLSHIEVLWQFGLVSSTGLLFNFIATSILIPSVLALIGDRHWSFRSKDRSKAWTAAYWRWLDHYRWWIAAFFIFISLIALKGFSKIHINHNILDNLGHHSAIRHHIEEINRNLSGLESFSIILQSGIEDTFLKVRYLEELEKIQNFIREKAKFRSSVSFADYLSFLNGAFQEMEENLLPENDDIVTELMIFISHREVKSYVNQNYSQARILVRHAIDSTEDLKQALSELNHFIQHNIDPGLKVHITGSSIFTLSATQAMINGQLQSIVLLLLSIILIIGLFFAELRVGLLAILPNFFPVIIMFGFMGFAGIPLNIGTTMAAAIAIGLAVDDTLHFMLRYNQQLRRREDSERDQIQTQLSEKEQHDRVMIATIHIESLPVIATSIALAAGFLVFTQASFEPIIQFGILGMLVILTALLADFMITPLVISSLKLVTLWDILSVELREQLKKSPLFRQLRPLQVKRFILSGQIKNIAQGDYVFKRSDMSNQFYLLLKGTIVICLEKEGQKPQPLEEFQAGDIFGEVALFAQVPRQTDAKALEDSTVLILSRDSLQRTSRYHPKIAARIFANLALEISKRMVGLINHRRRGEL